MKKKVYEVTYSFYEGCTDYVRVLALSESEAVEKAIDKIESTCTTDDWDIEDVKEIKGPPHLTGNSPSVKELKARPKPKTKR